MSGKIITEFNQISILDEQETLQIPIEKSELFLSISKDDKRNDFIPELCYKNGLLFTGDSLLWLKTIKDSSIDLVFADPPYNIKKADWDKFESQEEYINWSIKWIEEISRILKPTGSLYVCGFSEILADIKHPAMRYFAGCKWLIWNYRNKANLGNDWGRSHESILHLRKSKDYKMNIDNIRISYGEHTLRYPVHPQVETSQYSNDKNISHIWEPNPLGAKPKDVFEIPTICNGMAEKTNHPTQKPEELLKKILLASSNAEDIILDPFSGSGTTIVTAEQLGRKWVACEMNPEYNMWAVNRINNIVYRSVDEWILFDKANAKRRESIR
ncbi:MAG: site-specific DNA-methyltransferase [Oscillospiraceae bacterium]|nr:site-specific DNA-methyltransferase [Oscillospiraceae bacterium]